MKGKTLQEFFLSHFSPSTSHSIRYQCYSFPFSLCLSLRKKRREISESVGGKSDNDERERSEARHEV